MCTQEQVQVSIDYFMTTDISKKIGNIRDIQAGQRNKLSQYQ